MYTSYISLEVQVIRITAHEHISKILSNNAREM